MRITKLLFLASLIGLWVAPATWAVDNGQTHPRLNRATITSPNTTVDLVPSTSGAGNLKGINCIFDAGAWFRDQPIEILVDGGSSQVIDILALDFPQESDSLGRASTGFIPMNVRFGTSIQVRLKRSNSPAVNYNVTCVASWALD
jgi:hypothetical protein